MTRHFVHQAIAIQTGICDDRALAAGAFNSQGLPISHEIHCTPLSPPAIDFAGKSHPDSFVRSKLCNFLEQIVVNGLSTFGLEIVGMDDECHESVCLLDDA